MNITYKVQLISDTGLDKQNKSVRVIHNKRSIKLTRMWQLSAQMPILWVDDVPYENANIMWVNRHGPFTVV